MKAEKFPFDFVLTSTFRLDGKTLHHKMCIRDSPCPLRYVFGFPSEGAGRGAA